MKGSVDFGELRGAAIGPGVVVRAIVRGILHDRVVSQAEFIDQFEQFADLHVVLDHEAAT